MNRRELFTKTGAIAAAATTATAKRKTITASDGKEYCEHCWKHARKVCTCGDLWSVETEPTRAYTTFAEAQAHKPKTVINVLPGWFLRISR